MTSQREQIRVALAGGWTCGTRILEKRIPRYSARIHELAKTHTVEKRRCESHEHRGAQYEWRIRPNPGSTEALDQGCTCAVLDNNHGRFPPWPPDGWWITAGCPIHNPTKEN